LHIWPLIISISPEFLDFSFKGRWCHRPFRFSRADKQLAGLDKPQKKIPGDDNEYFTLAQGSTIFSFFCLQRGAGA
jgi:hypothetical protein